jgi:pyruvate formate lyase activating enzyme
MPPIKGLRKTCLIDYPPYTSAIVYLPGCNMRCGFCHNGSLVVGHDALQEIPQQEVLDFLKKRKMWLDAVVITGGEPTLHEDLPEFCRILKEMSYKVKLDTNGTRPEMLRKLIDAQLVDFIAMDIKAAPDKYPATVSAEVDMDSIEKSINLLKVSGIKHEFRTTAVPGLHTAEDFGEIGKMVAGGEAFALQYFRPQGCLDKSYESRKPFSREEMAVFKLALEPHIKVEIKNG